MAGFFKNMIKGALIGGGIAGYLSAPRTVEESAYAPFQNRYIAHRGLHSCGDGVVPENSLAAFRAACEEGYGIELDVQLSADGQVVVFHDDGLKRVCGVDAPVCSKTLEELKALPLLGSEERIPLFSEVLETVAGRAPLIVELKNGKRNDELCEKTLALLKEYTGDFCIESFSPSIVRWFREHAPQIVRGQLACQAKDYGADSQIGPFFLSHCLLNVLSRPHFIAYDLKEKPWTVRFAELLGAKKVCWTSRHPGDEVGQDTVIFEGYRPEGWF